MSPLISQATDSDSEFDDDDDSSENSDDDDDRHNDTADDGDDARMHDAATTTGRHTNPSTNPSTEADGGPVMHNRTIAHHGTINRVRAMPQQQGMVAVWADSGHVKVYDLTVQLAELANEPQPRPPSKNRPLQINPRHSHAHPVEGYALDWSPVVAGQLAAGDGKGRVHVWMPREGGAGWVVSGVYAGHTASVEDIQWSPTEGTVFASGASDNTVRIW